MENLINYPYITEYLEKILPPYEGFSATLEQYAKENHIPIIFKEVRDFFRFLLPILNPKKILEIGTAIGYSAIFFAEICPEAKITTIEIDSAIYEIARKNIKESGFDNRINSINENAADILPCLDAKYDLIFIDAAKGQYSEYYKYAKQRINPGGTLIFDNILYKGLPANDELVTHKHRTIANNLKNFNLTILNDKDFVSSILPLGDGLILARKETDQ